MKSLITLCSFLLISLIFNAQEKNVLFLGNSYIFTNDLPYVLDQLASSMSDPMTYEENTLAGYTLQQHSTNLTSTSLIADGGWDHVILQEQSQMPAFPISQVEQDVFPYAEALVSSVYEADQCAIPIMMMTWGRENGDQDNCDDWPPVCDYDGMQDLLTERYVQMAEDNECWTAPIGEAWRTVRDETDDLINLYADDGSHPSFAGTYLAACVLYATIWEESPVGADYTGGLSTEDAQYLQAVAAETVLETPEAWNIFPQVSAQISITGFEPSFTFTIDYTPAVDSAHFTTDDGTWTWTDMQSSTFFLNEGTHYYVIDLFSPCGDVNFLDSLVVGPTNVIEVDGQKLILYPNPATDHVRLEHAYSGMQYDILDSQGRIVEQGRLPDGQMFIDCREFPAGVYHLRIDKGRLGSVSLIVN